MSHTQFINFVVRVQARDDVDPEVIRQRLLAGSEDHVSSHGDAHVVSVQLLDLDTATGRQALDRVLHGDPAEVRGTASTCWCGQPHDHGVTP